MDITGLAAIVPGDASALGAAAAEMLAAHGAKVMLFDVSADLGHARAGEIGGRFAAVKASSTHRRAFRLRGVRQGAYRPRGRRVHAD